MNCLHCGSDKIDKILDEAMATWIKCRVCQRESVLGEGGNKLYNPFHMDGVDDPK